jgi:uncharacterized glyoxalase superfamily protein PhnB
MSVSLEPHLWVSDLPTSIYWYRKVLGFVPKAWFPQQEGATWCQMERESASLMLAVVPDTENLAPNQAYLADVTRRIEGPGGPLSLYLHVTDADAVYGDAMEAGAEVVEEIWDAWWGGRQFSVIDPDGIWWTVFRPDGD